MRSDVAGLLHTAADEGWTANIGPAQARNIAHELTSSRELAQETLDVLAERGLITRWDPEWAKP